VVLFEFLIIEVLARPTAEAKTVTPATNRRCRDHFRQYFYCVDQEPILVQYGERSSNTPQLRRLSSAATAGPGVTARDELASLLAEVSSYCSSLPVRHKKEFDTAWGIDAVEALAAIQHGEYDNNVDENMRRRVRFNAVVRKRVRDPLLEDLRRLGVMHRLSPHLQGKHLLSLLIFISSVNFNIITQGTKSISTRVGKSEAPLSMTTKIAAWIFIVLFNCTLLLYVLLSAISQTESRQSTWLRTFIMWLIMEIFVVSTLCMVLSRIVIPSFIMSEAGRVKESMLHVMEKYQAKVIAAVAARAGDNGAVVCR
jgi:hypothetical protein